MDTSGLAGRVAGLQLDNWYHRDLEGMYEPWIAASSSNPRLLVLNTALAQELGLDPEWLASPDGVAILSGNVVPAGATPLAAMAYSGHQFGGFSPRLGDGRALLLGELIAPDGSRHDLHLKGSGRTPFARGGDGKAAVGPMLREYIISEAMHALGIPTTRSLAVVATGDHVMRETVLPGAVLARTAASHLRVGSFQYAATHLGTQAVQRLADHAIARHYPHLADLDADRRYVAFLDAVVDAQARLVAQWMNVGFIHGVLNTDNTTISGETIDYGPCAFMDVFDPATVFSSIDHSGRYSFGNQPPIVQWNLARLAETLLPLIHADSDRAVDLATTAVQHFAPAFDAPWTTGMRTKLGLPADGDPGQREQVVNDLLSDLHDRRADFTMSMRVYGAAVNPIYIPRNHLVEEALEAAVTADDLGPMHRLLEAVSRPFDEREGFERYAEPAPESFCNFQTFCGT